MATHRRKSGTGSIHVPAKRRLSARRRDELGRELREFFLHEPGAVSSNYGGIAALALSGVRSAAGNPFGGDNAHDRMIAIHRAVDRYAEKRRAYLAIEDRYQLVLWLAFGPHKLPPEWRKALGYTAAAALITEAAKKACRRASGAEGDPTPPQLAAWLTRACVAGDTATLRPVIKARDELVEAALCAYAAARRADGPKAERRAVEEQKGGRGARGVTKRRTPIRKLLGVR